MCRRTFGRECSKRNASTCLIKGLWRCGRFRGVESWLAKKTFPRLEFQRILYNSAKALSLHSDENNQHSKKLNKAQHLICQVGKGGRNSDEPQTLRQLLQMSRKITDGFCKRPPSLQ